MDNEPKFLTQRIRWAERYEIADHILGRTHQEGDWHVREPPMQHPEHPGYFAVSLRWERRAVAPDLNPEVEMTVRFERFPWAGPRD